MKKTLLITSLLTFFAIPVLALGVYAAPNENANENAKNNPSNEKSNGNNNNNGNNTNNGNNGIGGPNANESTHKITLCHGTNSVTNPYVMITVDADAADGDTGNDKGQGDHSTHVGPVANNQSYAQSLKDSKTAWGDVIPSHDNYGGLNWDAQGQAVYNAGCNYASVTTTTTETPGVGGTSSNNNQGVAGTTTMKQGVMGLSQTSSSNSSSKELLLLLSSLGLIALGGGLSLKNIRQ